MEENKFRIEHDTMGEIRVPADKYWGAQTQRSFENFDIGRDHCIMSPEIIRAFGILKLAAAKANAELGVLDKRKAEVIETVCCEITRADTPYKAGDFDISVAKRDEPGMLFEW